MRGFLFAMGAGLIMASPRAAAQMPAPSNLDAPIPLQHWQQAQAGVTIESDGPGFHFSGKRGWTRTDRVWLDYVLHLEYRLDSPDAEGAVLLRAFQLEPNGPPTIGYRIAVRAKATERESTGTITAIAEKLERTSTPANAPALSTLGMWHTLDITCMRHHVSVRIDGQAVSDADGHEPGAGYVGLAHTAGAWSVRNMSVAAAPVSVALKDASDASDARKAAPELKRPTLKRSVKAHYVIGAMSRQAEGTVRLEVVIAVDGTVSDQRLLGSLDQDLDLEALAAGREWLFNPATLNGTPIPIIATLELDFRLRR